MCETELGWHTFNSQGACSNNHKSTYLMLCISRIEIESINLQNFKVNPFFTCFWGSLWTVFMPNFFRSVDSASRSDIYTWFSRLRIGLYRQLRYKDIHTKLAEMTWKRSAAFLTGSCSSARKLQSITNGTRDLFLQRWIALFLLQTNYETVETSNFSAPSWKRRPMIYEKQDAFWCFTTLSNRYRYASCRELDFSYSPINRQVQLIVNTRNPV